MDLIDYPQQEANWDRFLHWRPGRFRQHLGTPSAKGNTAIFTPATALLGDAARGTVRECLWAFAASDLAVSANDGAIEARQPTWLCRLPLVAGTPVESFHAALAARSLHDPLPGSSQSVYDALTECIH